MKPEEVIKIVLDNNSTFSFVNGQYLSKIERSIDKIKEEYEIDIKRENLDKMRKKAIFMCGDNANSFVEHKNDKLFPNNFKLDPAIEKEKR